MRESFPPGSCYSGAMTDRPHKDDYGPEEIAERMDKALRRAVNMPHVTQAAPKERKRSRPRKRVLKPRRATSSDA